MTSDIKEAAKPFVEAYEEIATAAFFATGAAAIYLPDEHPLVLMRYADEEDGTPGEPMASVTMGQLRALARACGCNVVL